MKHHSPHTFLSMTPTADDLYYDAMDLLANDQRVKARKLLLKAVELEPDSVQAYVGLTAVYTEEGKDKKARECVDLAFRLTQKKFRRWPERMLWGFIENRQFLRAIGNKAMTHQDDGEYEAAEKLYRLILKLNPHDNQGIRYLLAGLYAGMSTNDVDGYMEEGNRTQNWSKIEGLLEKQNAKRHFWKEPSD